MHDILAAKRAELATRATELLDLIAKGNQDRAAVADEGNRRIGEIKTAAEARIDAILADLEKHAEELAGVRHSTATIDAIAEKQSAEAR